MKDSRWRRVRSPVAFLLHGILILSDQGPILVTLFHLTFLKVPIPDTAKRGVRISTCKVEENTDI